MIRFALSSFDIKHLRTFLAVVEHGGVSSAAYRLNASISSISRDLSALEDRLGLQLCRRGRSGFALTPHGEEVHRAANELLSNIHSFELTVQSTRQSLAGTFTLGVIDNVVTNPNAGVIAALAEMHRLFPGMLINVSVHTVSVIDVLVRDNKVDFAITSQPEGFEQLQYCPAFIEEHRLYISRLSPYYEQAMDVLRGPRLGSDTAVPYISRDFRTDEFQAFERKYPLQIAARGSTLESVVASVLAGVGCALLPSHFVKQVGEGNLVEIETPDTPVQIQFHFVYRRDNADRRAVRALLDRFS
ncbi:LysR family transcriptional regulator [Agrobacterium tumefaciens]|uniref:Transcriptional regulator n=1 Tax=Agrobacterium tumefaciens TaxID=358 RepID=A0A2L2LKX4_AGRTU|nr:LysR family transcriptional regulator [Agrobacterium tumefaciens]AVH45000.1 transcriptional regulator [Agrobacterium tumefaciens]NSY98893.1 LysR family transcriptional regulator [Agrobacterium tumefaciens]